MELIKNIKAAEKKAEEIIKLAKEEACKMIEEAKLTNENKKMNAILMRKELLKKALEEAEMEAKDEIKKIEEEGKREKEKLREIEKNKREEAIKFIHSIFC